MVRSRISHTAQALKNGLDPVANQRRQSAAAAWKVFSARVTQVIPFSVIQRDTREKALAKGNPVPRIFDIHDVQAVEEIDGAERPRGAYFKLGEYLYRPRDIRAPMPFCAVKRFTAVAVKRMRGKGVRVGVNYAS